MPSIEPKSSRKRSRMAKSLSSSPEQKTRKHFDESSHKSRHKHRSRRNHDEAYSDKKKKHKSHSRHERERSVESSEFKEDGSDIRHSYRSVSRTNSSSPKRESKSKSTRDTKVYSDDKYDSKNSHSHTYRRRSDKEKDGDSKKSSHRRKRSRNKSSSVQDSHEEAHSTHSKSSKSRHSSQRHHSSRHYHSSSSEDKYSSVKAHSSQKVEKSDAKLQLSEPKDALENEIKNVTVNHEQDDLDVKSFNKQIPILASNKGESFHIQNGDEPLINIKVDNLKASDDSITSPVVPKIALNGKETLGQDSVLETSSANVCENKKQDCSTQFPSGQHPSAETPEKTAKVANLDRLARFKAMSADILKSKTSHIEDVKSVPKETNTTLEKQSNAMSNSSTILESKTSLPKPSQNLSESSDSSLSKTASRLDRFQRFKELTKQQDQVISQTVSKEQDSSVATDAKTAPMKLKLTGKAALATLGEAAFGEEMAYQANLTPDLISETSKKTFDSEKGVDPLDAYMNEIQDSVVPDQKLKETKDLLSFAAPSTITLDEIQGWSIHKYKWETLEEPALTSQIESVLDENTNSDNPTDNGTCIQTSKDNQNTESLTSTSTIESDHTISQSDKIVSSSEIADEEYYHKQFMLEMQKLEPANMESEFSEEKSTHQIIPMTPVVWDGLLSAEKLTTFDETQKMESVTSVNPIHSLGSSTEVSERMFSDDEDADTDYVPSSNSVLESYFDLVKKVGGKKELPPVDHSKVVYEDIKKNLYVQVREITAMKDHEVDALRKSNGNIKVRGKHCPRPITSFFQCGLPNKILKLLEKREYETPFPIQMQAIPALMCGRDVIGIAETGSGKTLAYVLPMIRHILHRSPLREGEGPAGLIIAPTRELTVQIYHECNKFCKCVNLVAVAVYGGSGIGEQLGQLRHGVDVVVGTPGRLIDVLTISNSKVTNLRRVSFAVLDEADRMFDMGFEPQISAIVRNLRPDRQMCLFSATFPTHIEAHARKVLNKPLEISVGEKGRSATRVRQYVEVRSENEKFLRLLQLLGEWSEHGSIIIFVGRQGDADDLFAELLKHGYQCGVLHGGQDQTDREFTIQDFKDGVKTILIATSVAARGLDVKSVVLVINYKVPDHAEDYVHRIGRTGRAGNLGVAYTFITPQEADKAEDLVKILKQSHQTVSPSLQKLSDTFKVQCNLGLAKAHKGRGFGGHGFKFTANEKSRQQQERQAAKKELGMDVDDEEDEEPFDMDSDRSIPPTPNVTTFSPAFNLGIPDGSALTSVIGSTVATAAARAKALAGSTRYITTQTDPDTLNAQKVAATLESQANDVAQAAVAHIQDENERQQKFNQVKESTKTQLFKNLQEQSARNIPVSSTSGLVQIIPTQIGKIQQTGGPALFNALLASRGIDKTYGLSETSLSALGTLASLAAGQVTSTIGNVPGLSPQGYIDPNTRNYVDEVDINDYPQQARFKVTHKEVLSRISEECGVMCQVKGQFVAPDQPRASPYNAKRLYVEIVGPTTISIQRASHELRMLMEAISVRQLNLSSTQRPSGRYQVI